MSSRYVFQPTRPLRGATSKRSVSQRFNSISTHAPLAGRDGRKREESAELYNFNPRAPCGARHRPEVTMLYALAFQPTRPLRGATDSLQKKE